MKITWTTTPSASHWPTSPHEKPVTGSIERAIERLNSRISDGLRTASEQAVKEDLEVVMLPQRVREMMDQRAKLVAALDVARDVLGDRFTQEIPNPFEAMTKPEDERFSFRVGLCNDPSGAFDELVVGNWIHIECMGHDGEDVDENPNDPMCWWARIGDAWIWVSVPHDGEPTVHIERGQYGDVRGSTNTWSSLAHRLWWRMRWQVARVRIALRSWREQHEDDA